MEWILLIASLIIAFGAQAYINATYNRMRKVPNTKGISGVEAARVILDNNGLNDVYVIKTGGKLTDHYDPRRKTIRLSGDIFDGTSVASIAVAAHEVGHAIQDKERHFFMRLRSLIFPIVKIASTLSYVAIMIGIFAGIMQLFTIGIYLLLATLAFELITLPVEFGASNRAMKELEKNNIVTSGDKPMASKMLKAAAFTYIASVVTTVLQILRLMSMSRR